jgi:hypothetical protein
MRDFPGVGDALQIGVAIFGTGITVVAVMPIVNVVAGVTVIIVPVAFVIARVARFIMLMPVARFGRVPEMLVPACVVNVLMMQRVVGGARQPNGRFVATASQMFAVFPVMMGVVGEMGAGVVVVPGAGEGGIAAEAG